MTTDVVKATTTFCPACEKADQLVRVNRSEAVDVRGERYVVEGTFARCNSCGEEFVGSDGFDFVAEAYRMYRQKHGMMQPEEVKAARQQYGLTQAELAAILGFGLVTLSRYETGMLQSESHDRILHVMKDPRSFLGLLRNMAPSPALSLERIDALKEKARTIASEREVLEGDLASVLSYAANPFSGNSSFRFDKFVNAILYYCLKSDWKTKINKFLFYVDFNTYKNTGRSMTGARYARLPHGPCPDKFERLFGLISDMGRIDIEEVIFQRYSGERIRALVNPNLGVFSEEEIAVLQAVSRRLRRMSAKTASDMSHKEKGYRETGHGKFIPYRYAKDLLVAVEARQSAS